MDFNFILLFIDSAFLQLPDFLGGDRMALGAEPEDAYVGGKLGLYGTQALIISLFAVSGFGILLNIFNSAVRRKMVDQTKLKRIMKATKAWQKERMAAMRSKDTAKSAELNKKSSYMNKMSMEMMQMNMRPMMITFVPLILIFYLVLPQLFTYTVAISPIPLNVIPGDMFQLTCTAEQALDATHFCFGKENHIMLWAWYFLSSIAFSGIIMRITKTSMDLG